jgi:hypothetical protein
MTGVRRASVPPAGRAPFQAEATKKLTSRATQPMGQGAVRPTRHTVSTLTEKEARNAMAGVFSA